ncbi:MAG TPA: alcohol dehydrogenase catalytic domain-containing protein [Armatimonadota bacterium]|jgi:alcohol dehydrogenase
MKALVFRGQPLLEERPVPNRGPEALLRLRLGGICNTDLELTHGYMGFEGVLGHEFVASVEQCDQPEWIGRRVAGEINCACGNCEACRQGLGRHCPHRTVLGIDHRDGCFSERFLLPVANLLEVPPGVSDRAAAFTEPLAAAFEILEQVHIQPMHRVAVLGDGKLGQLVARVLRLTGAQVTAVGRHPDKLARLERLGCRIGLESDPWAREFDVVVDATGSLAGFHAALRLLKPRGTLVLKSTVAASEPLNLALLVIDEIRLVGSRCGRFEPALRALQSGLVNVEDLIEATYPLEQGVSALEHAARKGALKVMLSA